MNSQERERRKIRDLARDYTQKGYEVWEAPFPKKLPKALLGHEPDLWLVKEGRNIWVEVKTSETIGQSPHLVQLAAILRELPDWQFELVLTNPRKKRSQKPGEGS